MTRRMQDIPANLFVVMSGPDIRHSHDYIGHMRHAFGGYLESELEKFRQFAASKKPNAYYEYNNVHECAIAQWYESNGFRYHGGHPFESIAGNRPHTFGGLECRLRGAIMRERASRGNHEYCAVQV